MDEHMRVLELIDRGEISVEEGVRRLEALAGAGEGAHPSARAATRPAWVRWVWQAVFWSGVGVLAGGGLLVTAVYAGEVAAGWLVWGWVLFALGLLGMMLGWWLQRAHWLFVRVRRSDGPNVLVALPLPLGPIAWGLRLARPFVPQLEDTAVDELILAMREEMRHGQPLRVEVDEGEGGERVQVYFG